MSKVIRVIAGVGLIVAGAITGNYQLIAAGITIGASALAKTPKAPEGSPENANRLFANIDTRAPRKMWFGQTASATDIRDQEYTDGQTYFHRFIVVASHKVRAISEIWFDDKLAWTAAGGAQGEFAGYLTVATVLEGSAGNAINISSRMGSTRRYTGLAYVHLKYKLTGNSKKAESPFAQSITTRVTIKGKGAYVYDPRLDSTVPGGAGACRADDRSTWIWDNDASRNPALQMLWYLLGWTIGGRLAVGKGVPAERIDMESFIVAANVCDEPVALSAGGTEPRYRSDGISSEAETPTSVLDTFKFAMNAILDDVNGKIRVQVLVNDLATPVATFDENDLLDSDFSWNPANALDDSFNIVRGVYTDASDNSLYQQVDYPQVEIASPDGIDRIDTFDLSAVQSAAQAQRLALMRLNRQQHGGTFEASYHISAWRCQKGDLVWQTFAPLGFVDKPFRVADYAVGFDGRVKMVLREEHADNYLGAGVDAAPVDPIPSTPFDPALDPIRLGIDESVLPTLINTSSQVGLAISATDTTVTVSDHVRRYSDKDVAVTGAALAGLDADTIYDLYYDDIAGRVGGAVTYVAQERLTTDDYFTAFQSPANPYRHYAGFIRTDVLGGGGTSGGGSLPPGGGGASPYNTVTP